MNRFLIIFISILLVGIWIFILDKTKENFEAVLVATGAWLPKKLDLTGADKDKVLYGIDYLKTDTKFATLNSTITCNTLRSLRSI